MKQEIYASSSTPAACPLYEIRMGFLNILGWWLAAGDARQPTMFFNCAKI